MTPPDETADVSAPAERALRACAAPALEGGFPAVLAGADGRIIAANAASGIAAGGRLPAETAARLARIVATLKPGKPRLERLRLPGAMAPATLACSLIVIPGARAVLLAAPGAAVPVEPSRAAVPDEIPRPAPPATPAAEADASADEAPCSDIAPEPAQAAAPPAPEPSPPHPAAEPETPADEIAAAGVDETPSPASSGSAPEAPASDAARPARWFWRTDPQGRLRALDPRLAAALGTAPQALAGHDFAALGAPELAQAVLAGGSFARIEARIATEGGAVRALFGGVPMRGDGMRGYALLVEREAASPGKEGAPPPPRATHLDSPPALTAASAVAAIEDALDGKRDEAATGTGTGAQDEAPLVAETAADVAAGAATESAAEPPEAAVAAGGTEIVPAAAEDAPVSTDQPDHTPHHTDQPPASSAPAEEPAPVRVMLSIVPSPPNVVPLRAGAEAAGETVRTSWAGLSAGERNAFREIARALGARLEGLDDEIPPPPPAPESKPEPKPEPPAPAVSEPDAIRRLISEGERPVLDRLPLGVLAYRGDELLYANKALLEWSGHADLAAMDAAGGLTSLFRDASSSEEDGAQVLTLLSSSGNPVPVEARLMSAPWEGGTAMLYILRRAGTGFDERMRSAELALREAEGVARELRAILDTATDGVVLIDAEGVVLSMNRSAEALFGYDSKELQGESFTLLFAPESRRAAVDYLDGLASNGVASVLNDGREVVGRVREGGLIPLFMTVGRIGEEGAKFCAVLRDITQWKRAEEELTDAKRLAEKANLAKSDFLAKISHEIRTPLNAIIGFSEVMMEERFGAIENERYREYLRDIHASGGHLISLINDLLDLSKIEAGKLDLAFTSVALNEIVQQCMAIMQGQANRERIIIRSQLAAELPPVVADPRSMRQIVLNLVSNSIKFSRPGGQVILSTALTEAGEVVLRVRDTGIGMSEGDIATAMEPFRQLATSGRAGSGGTGLGLPLTKALAEANRATFSIRSAVDAGTLVEITFPSTRVLAE